MRTPEEMEKIVERLAVDTSEAADKQTLELADAAYRQGRETWHRERWPRRRDVLVAMMRSRWVQVGLGLAAVMMVVAIVMLLEEPQESPPKAEAIIMTEQKAPEQRAAAEIAIVQKLYEMKNAAALTAVLQVAGYEAKVEAANYLALIGDANAVAPLEKASVLWKGTAATNPFTRAAEAIKLRAKAVEAADANSPTPSRTAPPPPTGKVETPPADPNMQTMLVKVVDKATGKPLVGAKIKATRGEKEVDGMTGKDGTSRIKMKQSGKALRLQVTCTGYVGQHRWLRGEMARNLPKEYLFELEKGITIGGIVKDAAGEPIEDVNVRVWRFGGDLENINEKAVPYLFEWLLTDSEGTWKCPGVPRDMDNLSIGFHHPQYQERGADAREAEQAAALEAGSLVTVLQRGLEIRGIVRRDDGIPVKGASILRGEQDCGEEYCKTTTDEQGLFRFQNAREGKEIVTVLAEGYGPESQTVMVAQDGIDIDFVLGPARTLKGRVVDRAGVPVRDATVSIGKWRDCRMLTQRATTDVNGRFELTGLPSDEMEVSLTKKGLTEKRIPAVVADGKENVFVFAGAVRVRGNVTDAETGRPIADFRLIPGVQWEADEPVIWQNMVGWIRSYRNGHYDYTFERAGAGYAVKIEADGYANAESRLVGADETDAVCDIALVRTGMVKGVVLGPDGKPGPGITVVIADQYGIAIENGELQIDYMRLDNGGSYLTAKTDPNGRFALTEPNVPYTVIAVGTKGAWGLSAEGFRETGRIDLRAWGKIEGQYLVGTKPAGRRQVKVEPEGSREGMGYIIARHTKLTDADGKFVIDKVLPGRMRVEWVPVEVAPGQTTHVTVGGRGRTVTAELEMPAQLQDMAGELAMEFWIDSGYEWWRWYEGLPLPPDIEAMTEPQIREWLKLWRETPEGKEWGRQKQAEYQSRRTWSVRAEAGRVTIEDLDQGRYVIRGLIGRKAEQKSQLSYADDAILATVTAEFEVPAVRSEDLDVPLDIGRLPATKCVSEGDDLSWMVADGVGEARVRITDYRGKVVLLVIHSTHDDNDHPKWAELRKAIEPFQDNDRLAMVGVFLESKEDPLARAMARENPFKWTQGFAGRQRQQLLASFGIMLTPRFVLIDREGRAIANGLRAEALATKLAEALAKP